MCVYVYMCACVRALRLCIQYYYSIRRILYTNNRVPVRNIKAAEYSGLFYDVIEAINVHKKFLQNKLKDKNTSAKRRLQ